MVLTIHGRESEHPASQESACYPWEIVNTALDDMVSEGLIEEEKLISFDVPCYIRSAAEVALEVLKEGSFTIDRLEVHTTKWRICQDQNLSKSAGSNFAHTLRAAVEPLLSCHFWSSSHGRCFL